MCDTLLKENPNMTLATDIICGFPGERDENHNDTLEIMKKYKFPIVNISQFYPRPGTSAASMKQVLSQTKKERSREVTAVFDSYKTNDFLVGKTVPVWFNEENSRGQSVGHTKEHVKVILD